MVRLVCTNLDGRRLEIANLDGFGRAFPINAAGGVLLLTEDQYERALSQLTSFKTRGLLSFTAQSNNAAWKAVCASTGPLPLSSLASIDGIVPLVNEVILVKDQADLKQNGLYVASAGSWSRVVDMEGQSILSPGLQVTVLTGVTNGDTQFLLSSDATEPGVDDIVFSPIGATSGSPAAGGTTTPLTWYVTTAGSDSTGDGSVGNPFLTPAGALAKLRSTYGERVRHLVKLLVGVGNFPGFNIQGWEIDPLDNTLPCGFQIIGSLIAPTLGSGTASGTFTAVTTGQITTDVVYSTVTDSFQTWTPNALRGCMLEVLTGTSALQMLPILENTDTTITITSTTAFGSIGGTYAIRDFGTVINTAVPVAPSPVAANSVSSPFVGPAHVSVFNNVMHPNITEVRLEQLKFNAVGAAVFSAGLNLAQSGVVVTRCFIGGTTVSSPSARIVLVGGGGTVTCSANILLVPAAGTGITSGGTGTQTLSQLLITGNISVPNGTNISTGISIGGLCSVNASLNKIEAAGFGVPITGQNIVSLSGTTIQSSGSQCVRCRVIEGNNGGSFISATGLKCIGGTAALEIQGPAFASITGLFITGSGTNGITIAHGGRVRLGGTNSSISPATLSGDIVLDDYAAPTTLTVLRAQTQKVLVNSYASSIWEL